jgi:hypothetical protein
MIRDDSETAIAGLRDLWPGKLPDGEYMTFVQLNAERQQLALLRLRAIREFQDGTETAKGLMQRLDLGRSQIYKLLQDWKANESLSSLVPHVGSAKARESRLDTRVIALVREVLIEHAGDNPAPSETTLAREIQKRALDKKLSVPADISVRRAIARLGLQDPELSLSPIMRVGKGEVSPGKEPAEEDEDPQLYFPQVFGGRLLVDHSTLDLIVTDGSKTFRPTVSVVVDDASRLILAHRLIDRIPELDDFLIILAFASEGYRRFRPKGISAVAGLHPVLTMRNGLSAQWNELRSLAEKARFKFDIRRAPKPVFGHVLRRSMISSIGKLRLLPRYTMQQPVDRLRGNDAGKPVVPWADALVMLDEAVAEHNRERLMAVSLDALAGTGRNANLRLNTEKKDWLEYGLSVFRNAWASR